MNKKIVAIDENIVQTTDAKKGIIKGFLNNIKFINPTKFKSFKALLKTAPADLREVLTATSIEARLKEYEIAGPAGIRFNFGTSWVTNALIENMIILAKDMQLVEKFIGMMNGGELNTGEKRKVLHPETRSPIKHVKEWDLYQGELKKLGDIVKSVHEGSLLNEEGETYTDVVQIGIGGSDLGPVAMFEGLEAWARTAGLKKMNGHFISNVDPDDMNRKLDRVDLSRTLFTLVSKSGTTDETLTNEQRVREKLKELGLDPAKHFIAITSETSPLATSKDFITSLFMDDNIGGRLSSTSMVGAILALCFGMDTFNDFLSGAHEADQLACETDIRKNPMLLDALYGIYLRNGLKKLTTAVIPYSQALSRFAAHLQQLDMESNGKRVNIFQRFIKYATGPIIWGEPGTNAQHSFFQWLHQRFGDTVPIQFISFLQSQSGDDLEISGRSSQEKLSANLYSQMVAFALGSRKPESPNDDFEGNVPSTLLFANELTPRVLGALLAYYEAKVIFQGLAWNVCSTDQVGVQLGKKLAKSLLDGKNVNPVLTALAKHFGYKIPGN